MQNILSSIVSAVAVMVSANALSAKPLTQAEVEQCIQTGLRSVLQGQADAAEYIDFGQVVYRVFGPPARSLKPAAHREAAVRLGAIMSRHIDRHKHRFKTGVVSVTYVKQSARSPKVYGAEGTVSTPSQYDFSVHGTFESATRCRFHGIWIKGGRPMVQYLKDQPEVMALCTEMTGMQC